MAATSAYIAIAFIPTGPRQGEALRFSNISATTAAFGLAGGQYGVTCKASTYGTVTLQTLAADDATWLVALTAISADGTAYGYFPPGQYRFALA